jgi:hypothetical protein
VNSPGSGSGRPGGCRALALGLLVMGFSCSLQAQGGAAQAPGTRSLFQRTLTSLQAAAPEIQSAFAIDALRELAAIYLAEADLARREAAQGAGDPSLLGWSSAVDRYADELLGLLEDIDLGHPPVLSLSPEGDATVTVAGRAVILTHPRARQQAAFEQQVLAEFCARHQCESLTGTVVLPAHAVASGGRPSVRWEFTERGHRCSRDGLVLRFDTVRQLAQLRSTCEQLLQEASALAAEIGWQRRRGVPVAWRQLSSQPTARGRSHLVSLNGSGDAVLAYLPLLNDTPGLLADLAPWLQARAEGEAASLELDAARYGLVPGSP